MSSENSICMGCFIDPLFYQQFKQEPFHPFSDAFGLAFQGRDNSAEKMVLFHLAEAFENFNKLDWENKDNIDDFRRAIHDAQRIIALRFAWRNEKDTWKKP